MASSLQLLDLAWSTPSGRSLFSGLNLTFGPVLTGLVGRNGVGKTTLLKLMTGGLRPRAGKIVAPSRLGTLRQTVRAAAGVSIADLLGVTDALALLHRADHGQASDTQLADVDWTLETRLSAALARVGLSAPVETPLTQLSGGQQTRASLAALLWDEPEFLLLDEPTNNLDRDGRRAVIDLLGGWKSGAIVVSHDRELLEAMDAIVELTSLGAKTYGGNWSRYRELKALELEAARRELAAAERQVSATAREVQQTKERQTRRSGAGRRDGAKGGTPKILLGARKNRAENTTGEQARLAARQREQARDAARSARERVEVLEPLTVALPPTDLAASKLVVRLEEVTAGYQPAQPIIRNLSFRVNGPERVAIAGANGSGKTTLLSLLSGRLQPLTGEVHVATEFALLDQQVTLLEPDATIRDNFRRLQPAASENDCRAALARFMFRSEAALQSVATLSGGQLLRAGLACVLGGKPPPLLMLDEPTNHLDIDSIEAVEAGLRAYDGALLVVSHDASFLKAIGISRTLNLSF